MKQKQALEAQSLAQLPTPQLDGEIETLQATLSPVGAGKRLAEVAGQFTLTAEDVEELERLIRAPLDKAASE